MILKGWCPGALRPMPAGDGLLLRLRPRAGRLTPPQITAIAALAQSFGNGTLDLGSRATLQLRGIRPEGLGALQAKLAQLDLMDSDPEREARRNILTTPLWAQDDTLALLEIVEEALAEGPDLPPKFGICIDTGTRACLQRASADLRIELCAEGRLILRADGCDRGEHVTRAQLSGRLQALLAWFAHQGAKRMREVCQHQDLPLGTDIAPRPQPASVVPNEGHQLFYAPFGAVEAESFAALAGQPLRLTPWRAVLSEGAPPVAPWLTDSLNPRLAVQACPGPPACPAGQAPTRALATALARHLPKGRQLHISGCAKGCSGLGQADLTLTAHQGTYDLVAGPDASASPIKRGLTATQLPDVIGGYFASHL